MTLRELLLSNQPARFFRFRYRFISSLPDECWKACGLTTTNRRLSELRDGAANISFMVRKWIWCSDAWQPLATTLTVYDLERQIELVEGN